MSNRATQGSAGDHTVPSPTTNGSTAGPGPGAAATAASAAAAAAPAAQCGGRVFENEFDSVAARLQRSDEDAAQRMDRHHRLLSHRLHYLSASLGGGGGAAAAPAALAAPAAPVQGRGGTAAGRDDHDLAHIGAQFRQ